MLALSQEKRLIRIDAPSYKDAFIALNLEGEESVSDLYRFSVELQSADKNVDPTKLVGQGVTLSIHYRKDAPRHIHGVVNNFNCLGMTGEGLRRYHMTLVPRLWFLNLSGSNRIFHNMSTADIVGKVLKDCGIDFQYKAGKYDKRAYCIQYHESDYDFITRLLAEEGISFYFTHAEGKHTLVIADKNAQFFDCDEGEVPCDEVQGLAAQASHIHNWQHQYSFHTGGFAFADHIESKPTTANLAAAATKTKLTGIDKFEREYYASYVPYDRTEDLVGHGRTMGIQDYAKVYVEGAESQYDTAAAESNCCSFGAGGRFTLQHDILDKESKKYLITTVYHQAHHAREVSGEYSNSFSCQPADVPLRPQLRPSRARMDGPHIATVKEVKATDSAGADPQTMVKVQFMWDTEQTSCMVRVAQAYAGKNWGSVFVPRVGQDVIVEFMGGDPDRPVITGAVYNAANKAPPYTKTQSGLKTESSKFNELRFDDKGGAEEIYMEAGKDHNFLIHNDQKGTIENNQALQVKVNRDIAVDGNQSHAIKGNNETDVKGNQSQVIKGNDDTDVKGNIGVKSAQSIDIQASMAINLKVGGNKITIDNTGVSINGTMVKINGSAMAEVKGGGMLTLKGGLTTIN